MTRLSGPTRVTFERRGMFGFEPRLASGLQPLRQPGIAGASTRSKSPAS